MKKSIALFVLVTFAFLVTTAQNPCLQEGITFTSQEQIDNFQTNYPGCTQIEGEVGIAGADIVNLNGLNVLTSIGGTLIIIANGNLTTLSGLDNLESIGGNLEIEDNNALATLSGLEGLTSVSGNLYVRYNDVLLNLSGLNSLSSIGGHLLIDDNPFTDLAGLENLTSVGGYITIFRNSELTSLDGLDNIDPESITGLSIINNPLLSSCDVHSICDFLLQPTGEVEIYGNAFGCNNASEITENCTSDIDDISKDQPRLYIRSNPANEDVIIIVVEGNQTGLRLVCFNILGQEIEQQEITGTETMVNVRTWQNGIYTAVVYEKSKPISRAKFLVR